VTDDSDIVFDVLSDGHGGFTESSLFLDAGSSLLIDDTHFEFDFLDGADPRSFFDSGDLNLNTFFQVSDGNPFSSDFNLATDLQNDTFSINIPDYNITSFNPSTGALSLPDTTSSGILLLLAIGAIGAVRLRRIRAGA
jgi:hypothetical protein